MNQPLETIDDGAPHEAPFTVDYDLSTKRHFYAAQGVPEHWVAVERSKRLERFVEPTDGRYTRHERFPFADGVESLTLPGVRIAPGLLHG